MRKRLIQVCGLCFLLKY